MPTLKRQRQKLAAKVKKSLGLKDFVLARKIAKSTIDCLYDFDKLKSLLDSQFGEATFYPGCECCGDKKYTWTAKNGNVLQYQFHSFKVISA